MPPLVSCSRGHANPSSHRFCQQCGERLGPNIQVGQMVGDRYRIIEALGRGGFGHTYLVEDSNRFNERCVLKIFAPEVEGAEALAKAKELFTREAEVLYRLEHPQIPRFREWFMEEPSLYLVQDYVEGRTYKALLEEHLQQGNCFSETEVAHFLRQTLPILDYIHGRGLIHRDISPDNLMLRNCDHQPVLIDFGGVKEITASFGYLGTKHPHGGVTLIGKPGYAPEEQIRLGRVSAACDIYALGVTALVLLVGKEPQDFFDPNACLFQWRQYVQLSPEFAALLEKMVASHAAKRYRSAAQVLQDLKHQEIAHIVDGTSTNSEGAGATEPASPVGASSPSQSVSIHPPIAQEQGLDEAAVTQQTLVVVPPESPTPPEQPNRVGFRRGLTKVTQVGAVVFAMITAGTFAFSAVYNWLTQSPVQSAPTGSPQRDRFSEDEDNRKRSLFQRLRDLKVNQTYFNQVTNEAFYLKHPNYPRRPLTTGAADAKLRAHWDAVGLQVVDALEAIQTDSRRQIGRYGPTTRQTWDRKLQQARLNPGRFYREIDRRFERQLPMYRDQSLAGKRGQQIWFALAADHLQKTLN